MDSKINDAAIYIKSTQQGDGEYSGSEDSIELFTAGSYYQKNGTNYIRYTEQGEGMENIKTTVKVEGDERVTVMRRGERPYELILQKGERRHSVMDTGYGEMLLGISGTKIRSDLNEKGGNLRLEYMLDINNILISRNTLEISVKDSRTES